NGLDLLGVRLEGVEGLGRDRHRLERDERDGQVHRLDRPVNVHSDDGVPRLDGRYESRRRVDRCDLREAARPGLGTVRDRVVVRIEWRRRQSESAAYPEYLGACWRDVDLLDDDRLV